MKGSYRLREDVDIERAVIRNLEREQNKSGVVRDALIQYYEGAGLSNAVLSDKLEGIAVTQKRILSMLEAGNVVTNGAGQVPAGVTNDGLDYLDTLGV